MITGGFSRIVEHNYLTKSRGKQGYDEEDIFTLMMVYASKKWYWWKFKPLGMVPNIIFSELAVYIKTGKQIQCKIDKALEIIRGDKYRWVIWWKSTKRNYCWFWLYYLL